MPHIPIIQNGAIINEENTLWCVHKNTLWCVHCASKIRLAQLIVFCRGQGKEGVKRERSRRGQSAQLNVENSFHSICSFRQG